MSWKINAPTKKRVKWYTDLASFPVTWSKEIIYIDETTSFTYVWDWSSYKPSSTASGGWNSDASAINSLTQERKNVDVDGVLVVADTASDNYITNDGIDVANSTNTFYLEGWRKVVNDWIWWFFTKLYTGNLSALSVTWVWFQPDFVWIKSTTDGTQSQWISDVVRGANNRLATNASSAQSAGLNGLSSFDADGFTMGASTQININSATYAAWCFECPDSQTPSTDGSITPATETINLNIGMSIIKFDGTGANATIGHNLGTTPAFIITKNIDADETWRIYHHKLGIVTPWVNPAGSSIRLDNTAAQAASAAYWNDTEPTSTVFSVGTTFSANTYIAYIFSEISGFSKFWTYEGDWNASNAITWTWFEPEMIIIKNIDNATPQWYLVDNTRGATNMIQPNTVGAAFTDAARVASIDADGFTVGSWDQNNNGETYVYMAFGAKWAALDIDFISEPIAKATTVTSITSRALFTPTDASTLDTDIKLFVSRVQNSDVQPTSDTDYWTQATLTKESDVTTAMDFISWTAVVTGQTDSTTNTEIRYRWEGFNTKKQEFQGTHLEWS